MRNGAQVVLLDGDEDLEVVGESYYQDNLWQLAGAQPGQQRVRENVYAVLVAEDDNPYDRDAVAVWINGLKVGHLSRENAHRYRPGLLAQQQALGKPIALAGVITGGGIRSDGPGKLGVFLRHDPQDFGLPPHLLPAQPEPRMRAAAGDLPADGHPPANGAQLQPGTAVGRARHRPVWQRLRTA
jgi:HIRAN domain-containing protein